MCKCKNSFFFLSLILIFSLTMEALATDYMVSGAGTAGANGTYAPDGTNSMGLPRWKHTGGSYYLHSNRMRTWVINDDGDMSFGGYYRNMSQNPFDASTPPSGGWERDMGTEPAPTVNIAVPNLTYSSDAFFESRENNGTITPIIITHNNFGGETFAGSDGDDFVANGNLVVTNLPAGLTAVATRTSSTQLSVTLAGTPGAGHEKADTVTNLTFAFQNTAFSGGDASAVKNSTRSDLSILFNEWPLNMADASFLGENAGDEARRAVTGVGDVNGDGYDDFLISTWYGDKNIYLILGKDSGLIMDISLSDADASFVLEDSALLVTAIKISGTGDVNKDGYDDFLIGAQKNDEAGADAGQAYLILGKASGWAMDTSLSSADASFLGETSGDVAGSSVSGAGDVNNDGYDDFLIGANNNDEAGSNAGQT